MYRFYLTYKGRREWAGTGMSPARSVMTIITNQLCSMYVRPHADLVLGVLLCFFLQEISHNLGVCYMYLKHYNKVTQILVLSA